MKSSSNEVAQAFATVLRMEAARRNLTQSQVAHLSGLHANTVRHYWHARRSPGLEAVLAIEQAFGMEPGHLAAATSHEASGR